jgi:hypothetical protein
MRFSRSRTISRRIRLPHEYGKLVSKTLAMNVFGVLVFLAGRRRACCDSAAIWLPGGAWALRAFQPMFRRFGVSPKGYGALLTFSASGSPRHYFRYEVLFHRGDYNLVATTTKTPAPRRMTCLTL